MTLMVAEQVEELPAMSVTVSTTVLGPALEQVKLVWLTLMLSMAQLSVLPLSTSLAARLAFPRLSRASVRDWQTAFGATLSITVTVNAQVAEFPVASSAV